ncbi:K+ transporter [Pseudomonas psychrotolerans]|nr:K+ transporter [Pseudomonas psychrotolerans]
MSRPEHDREQGGKAPSALGMIVLATGVVYGDIGTSPLYTLKEVFSPHYGLPLNHDSVLGILSLIFWSLIWVVTIKYITFVMRADNQGEGGIMALTALARRAAQGSPRLATTLVLLGLFGAALFYGDSMITPAVSVLSAVEGLELAFDGLEAWVVPISLIILVGIFAIQKRGTATIGKFFGPVMVLWFTSLGALGVYGIVQQPEVLKAFNPYWAVEFFAANPVKGFIVLGAAVLALTGAEALYADMGHFGRKPIARAWLLLVLPGLVLNYFGQGALLLADPSAVRNPFYLLAPEWLLLPLIGLATLATVIASQAVITGAFSMTRQAIQLGYIPRMQIQHTSSQEQGQIYIPLMNWTLMLGVIFLILTFQSSANLAEAYGVAVTGTMLITSCLVSAVILLLWKWPTLGHGAAADRLPAGRPAVFLRQCTQDLFRRLLPGDRGHHHLHPADHLEARAQAGGRAPGRWCAATADLHQQHPRPAAVPRQGHRGIPHRPDRRGAPRHAAQPAAQPGAA